MDAMTLFFSCLTDFAFPIVCTVFLAWYVVTKDKETKATITKMEDTHKDEINMLRQAVEANTLALNRVIERIDR